MLFMFRKSAVLIGLVLAFLTTANITLAQTSSFTYQGKLNDSSAPANGTYQMQFGLFDAATNGNQIGPTITNNNVTVSSGVFSVQLDFGASSFPGPDRWLEISAKKPSDPTFTTLSPRQQINSVPYAVTASNVNLTSGDNIVSVLNNASTTTTISDTRLPSNIVRLEPSSTQTSTGTNSLLNLGTSSGATLLQYIGDGGFLVTGTVNTGAVPTSGAGTRFMWYPGKAAIRAGGVGGTQWDDANTGMYSTAFGFDTIANGTYSFAAGQQATASAVGSVALGESVTASGADSVALGSHANTNAHQGAFVFGDRSTTTDLLAGVNFSANWRVSGGFRIFTSTNLSTGVTIQSGTSVSNWGQASAVISTSTGAFLSTGGVWQNASSRTLKENFVPVDSRSILRKVARLPIQTWSYKVEKPSVRHIGPVSQDFSNTFHFGGNDETIGTVDADGVALASIQGLYLEIQDRDKKIQRQQNQLSALQKQLKQQQVMIESLRKAVCAQNPQAEVCK